MNSLQLSARFAALLWFARQPANRGKSKDEAQQFARQNWEHFLPSADAGMGQLLLTMAAGNDADADDTADADDVADAAPEYFVSKPYPVIAVA